MSSTEYIPLDGAPYIPDKRSPHYWDSKHDVYGLDRKLFDLVEASSRGASTDEQWFGAAMACAMDHIKPVIEVIEVRTDFAGYTHAYTRFIMDLSDYLEDDDYWEEKFYE